MKGETSSTLNEPVSGERSVEPTVALPRPGLSGLAIFIGAIILGAILFGVLDANRRAATAPAVINPVTPNTELAAAPPPLDIPEQFPFVARREPIVQAQTISPSTPPPSIAPAPVQNFVPPSPPPPPPVVVQEAEPPVRTSTGAALVVDNSSAPPVAQVSAETSRAAGPSGNTERVRAAIIANRSTTVPQGTLIKAVLETALNSTNPGFARAIVSRNVHGFDGTRILIPRGSRLIGEYRADVSPGQKRALINWTRLIRPDGVTIAIGSPATGPLGRGGVKADVDTHFFERFSAAIFQSALDVGVNLASRQADGTVIIAPTSSANLASNNSNRITPTLKVKPGASISVFVARDLDFTDVETAR